MHRYPAWLYPKPCPVVFTADSVEAVGGLHLRARNNQEASVGGAYDLLANRPRPRSPSLARDGVSGESCCCCCRIAGFRADRTQQAVKADRQSCKYLMPEQRMRLAQACDVEDAAEPLLLALRILQRHCPEGRPSLRIAGRTCFRSLWSRDFPALLYEEDFMRRVTRYEALHAPCAIARFLDFMLQGFIHGSS